MSNSFDELEFKKENKLLDISCVNSALNIIEIEISGLARYTETIDEFNYYQYKIKDLIEKLNDLLED